MKAIVKELLTRFGLHLSRTMPEGKLIDHSLQNLFESAYLRVRDNTMLKRQRLSLLFELVRHLVKTDVPGAFIECGVWKGGAIGMMALAAQTCNAERDVHLCDSFTDIGEPDWRIDGERAVREVGGIHNAQGRDRSIKGIYDRMGGHGTVEACRELIEGRIGWPPSRLHFHEGWFQDTIPDLARSIGPISLLRIDADWYSSTSICLSNLYDGVVPGGVIIVDDYGGYEGCRKAVDEFLESRALHPFLNHVDDECIYWFRE